MKRILHILHGWLFWRLFCIVNNVSFKCVVLVLNNENQQLDKYAVEYLDIFLNRRAAKKAFIIWSDDRTKVWLDKVKLSPEKKLIHMPFKKLKLLYDFYCFDKFFDNIVFTFISKPQENLLGRILNETDINEKDAVCLALYHLRYVPE